MKNQNFQFLISKQKQEKKEVKTDSFDGTVLGIIISFIVLIGVLAYVDRWVPILSKLF